MEDLQVIVVIVALIPVLLSCAITMAHVLLHLKHYSQPKLQKPTIRILVMVPIYGLTSLLSLMFPEVQVIFILIRTSYESYILYQFFVLLVQFINNYEETERFILLTEQSDYGIQNQKEEEATKEPITLQSGGSYQEPVILIMEKKPRMGLLSACYPIPCPSKPSFQPNRRVFRIIKWGILQFTLITPLLSAIAIILWLFGLYEDGNFSFTSGYLYLSGLENLSISLAAYCLIFFYSIVKKELKPFNPMPKFLCIKAIVVFAFWQGIFIALLYLIGVFNYVPNFTPTNVAAGLQNLLICIEMLPLAVMHLLSYHYEPYRVADHISSSRKPLGNIKPILKNARDVISQKDMMKEILPTKPKTNYAKEMVIDEEDIPH